MHQGDLEAFQRLVTARKLADGTLNRGLYKALAGEHLTMAGDLLGRGIEIDQFAIDRA